MSPAGSATLTGVSTEPAGNVVTGSSADGRVRAAVDATGRLVDLVLDGDLLRRPAWVVADAIVAAVTQAQDAVRRPAGAPLDLQAIAADVEAAGRDADRRLAEFTTVVSDLARRDGGWR